MVFPQAALQPEYPAIFIELATAVHVYTTVNPTTVVFRGILVAVTLHISWFPGLMSVGVGLITTATFAESILQEGKADLVLFARELLRNPYLPLNAAREQGVDVTWPVQYLRAK